MPLNSRNNLQNRHTAFGSVMQTRSFSSVGYRYGFNGKEKEADGTTDNYDFGARIYDGRLGRWLSVDPLFSKYPNYSVFNFALNCPTLLIDKDGKEVFIYGSQAERFVAAIQAVTALTLHFDPQTNKLSILSRPPGILSVDDDKLIEALGSETIKVGIYTTTDTYFDSKDGKTNTPLLPAAYEGSFVSIDPYFISTQVTADDVSKCPSYKDCSSTTGLILNGDNDLIVGDETNLMIGGSAKILAFRPVVNTVQVINMNAADKIVSAGLETIGQTPLHELLESYLGGLTDPGGNYESGFQKAHQQSLDNYPINPLVINNNTKDKKFGLIDPLTNEKVDLVDSNGGISKPSLEKKQSIPGGTTTHN